MLQILNDKLKGIFASIILVLIIASFAFVGLNELFFSKNTQIAATVDGEKIDWKSVVSLAARAERERGVPTSPQSLEEIRNALAQTQALIYGLQKTGFHMTERQVAKALAKMTVFQDESGKFSKAKYLAVLKNFDYQDDTFRQELSKTLLLSQVEQGMHVSNFWLPYEVRQAIEFLLERRNMGYAVLSHQDFANKVEKEASRIQAYYETHKTHYIRPEQVSLHYVDLRLHQVIDEVKASNLELKNFYLENQGFYNTPEMRRARHILFSTEGKDPETQSKQAAAAETVLAELKAGKSFEALATEWSEDEATRAQGGDMGWVGKGDLDIALEEALFALTFPNELSPVIKSADGYHIIQLLEQKMATVQLFETVKESVSEQYRRQKAQQLFEDKKEQLAALAFESPDSLDKIKQIMNLPIVDMAPFDRQGRGAEKWSQYPELLRVAFSSAIISEKKNSGVIQLTPERAIVVRLNQHLPAEQQSFEQVADQVKQDYIHHVATQRLKEAAEQIVTAMKAGKTPEEALKPYAISWQQKSGVSRQDQSMDRWIVDKAFMLGRAPLAADPQKPVIGSFLLPSGDWGILAVTKVTLGNPDQADKKTIEMAKATVWESWTRAEFGLWEHDIISKANIRLAPMPSELQQTAESQ